MRAWRALAAWVPLVLLWTAGGCSTKPDGTATHRTPLNGGFSVVTRNYDNLRTGATPFETTLSQANVNATQFGKLFQVTVDDQVYAQILFGYGVFVAGSFRDVFFVATVNNAVSAFDAHTGALYWHQNFTPSGARPTRNGDDCSGITNFTGNNGLVGTPVIDLSTTTMYFVARTVDSGGATVQRLHAIDIATGLDKPNISPKVISAFAFNTTFDPLHQNQRAALTLNGNSVYVNWASYCDQNTWHGWTMAFDKSTLALQRAFPATKGSTTQAGIWHGGGGMAVDIDGNMYAATGNGPHDSVNNFGFSLLKLRTSGLTLTDFFTGSLMSGDTDFGSSGPVFLPNSNLVTVGSKEGVVYVVNRNSMGHFVQGDTQIVQRFQAVQIQQGSTGHIHGTDVSWVGPDGVPYLYVWGENDYPRRYHFNTSTNQFNLPASDVGPALPAIGMPGGMMTLSSNASAAGSGVLWATAPLGDAENATVAGVFRAFNAETLALLWQSSDSWMLAKFNPPVVAQGQVYVPTFSNVVNVYGIVQSDPVTNGQIVVLRKRNSTLPAVCVDVPFASSQTVQLQVVPCNGSIAEAWQLNKVGASWEIRRQGAGMCMDIPGGSAFAGQAVQQAACNGSAEQQFSLASALDGIALKFGGLCVTLPNNNTAPGTLLQLGSCLNGVAGDDSQVFTPVPSRLRKQDSGFPGMCVDVPNGVTTPGVQLQTFNCNAQEWQAWQPMWWSDGTQGMVRNGTNLCFDIPNGIGFSGATVTQFPCNGGSGQKFFIDWLANGYQIRFADGQNLCVNVPNNSNDPHALLQLLACNQTEAQIFSLFQPQLRKTTSGASPGLCVSTHYLQTSETLTPCDGTANGNWMSRSDGTIWSPLWGCMGIISSPSAGASIGTTSCVPKAGSNQWTVVQLPSGGSEIVLTGTGYCIDIPWGWNKPGTIQLYPCNGNNSQQFSQ